jgi:hypothetical protein
MPSESTLAAPRRASSLSRLLALSLLAGLSAAAHAQNIRYVRADANVGGDGLSWATAFRTLDIAVNTAPPNTQVWVAAGTYVPTALGASNLVSLRVNVSLLGGFVGNETSESQRNPAANVTILSGDALRDDDIGGSINDNATIVIDVPPPVLANSVVDGFTIRSARQNGMRIAGSITVRNCIFTRNIGFSRGCATHIINPVPSSTQRFINCRYIANGGSSGPTTVFTAEGPNGDVRFINSSMIGNQAGNQGVFTILAASPSLTVSIINSQFVQNRATGQPGAAVSLDMTPAGTFQLINSTIAGNDNISSPNSGLSVQNAAPSSLIRNSIFWGNTTGGGLSNEQSNLRLLSNPRPTVDFCRVQGWTGQFAGTASNGSDPKFVDLNGPDDIFGSGDENVRLLPDSSAIDAGNNFYVPADTLDLDNDGNTTEPLPFDNAGGPRFLDEPSVPDTGVGSPPIVDLGAFERGQPFVPCDADFNKDGTVDFFDYLDFVAAFDAGCP